MKRKRQDKKSHQLCKSEKGQCEIRKLYETTTANRKILRSKNTKETPVINTDCPTNVKVVFPAFSKSLNKGKRSLPKDPVQKRVITKALFEN